MADGNVVDHMGRQNESLSSEDMQWGAMGGSLRGWTPGGGAVIMRRHGVFAPHAPQEWHQEAVLLARNSDTFRFPLPTSWHRVAELKSLLVHDSVAGGGDGCSKGTKAVLEGSLWIRASEPVSDWKIQSDPGAHSRHCGEKRRCHLR